jgi:hypothetical protein
MRAEYGQQISKWFRATQKANGGIDLSTLWTRHPRYATIGIS